MMCPTCFGIGEVLIDRAYRVVTRLRDAWTMIPCPDCGGHGVAYCCSGEDRACPDTPADAGEAP